MNKIVKNSLLIFFISFAFVCEEKKPMVFDPNQTQTQAPLIMGKVIETMNSGGYSYVQVEVSENEKHWAATSEMDVSVGDTVFFKAVSPMENFFSKTLNKTFPRIFFVAAIEVKGKEGLESAGVAKGSERSKAAEKDLTVKPGSIPKAKGGYTVAELYSLKNSLNGRDVLIRGKVVKYSEGIMGKNWLHLQDGTGKNDANDITITTKGKISLGDIVLISGKISYDKDIGSGYFYKAIIEDAEIKK
ncbi:MAG: DNA-binding protein [Spirochaetia bacterium]|nr:DNA-binding protein [Spirochaetia bacterium]